MTPAVSFVVPCYKLAHLLQQCVDSILCQTYANFEVLIMDDCSPDNTPEVAQSFRDPRVKHVRNDPNLGHLRNYNKGISLARGRYVWLISADDYLRRPYILERYVDLLDRNPRAGYAFCPGVGVKNGNETETLGYSVRADRDEVIRGHVFLRELLRENIVLAASGLVRRKCYEQISLFPLDMPWAGDWYLWCIFALYYDVAYFAEPMVCYREHDLSMTSRFTQERVAHCAAEDVLVRWAIRRRAGEAGYRDLSRRALGEIADYYARGIVAGWYGAARWRVTVEQFEESLCQNVTSESERNWARARLYAGMGDRHYSRGELAEARRCYVAGLRKDPRLAKAFAKWSCLFLGKPGDYLRGRLRRFRQRKTVASTMARREAGPSLSNVGSR